MLFRSTKLTAVAYDPAARAPQWRTFLEQIFSDVALHEFMQRAAGYSMTVDMSEECFFKSHIVLGLGSAACQKGLSVGFIKATALVHELLEACDEKRLLHLQRQLAVYRLLNSDELGCVPLSATGAVLLFEVFSQRYERGSILVTSNLPFDEWTSVFGSERLTGALLDRLTHHVHILEMNGDSFRLAHSKRRSRRAQSDQAPDAAPQE